MLKINLDQKQKIKEIGKKNGLLFAVAFGSATTGKRSAETDLDIAVLTKKEPDYRLFKKLFSAFSDVFEGENVDLRFLNGADPLFRSQAVKNGQLLYGNRKGFDEFRAYAYRSLIDDGRKYFPYLEKLIEQNQKILEANL